MKDKSQLTHFERNRKFIADIFDVAIEKAKQKNKKIHFNILASKIRFSEKKLDDYLKVILRIQSIFTNTRIKIKFQQIKLVRKQK